MTTDPAIKRKRANVRDIVRDCIYGAGLKVDISVNGKKVICIPVSDVTKVAKRIVRRASIGPI